jgi:hypothetical protein
MPDDIVDIWIYRIDTNICPVFDGMWWWRFINGLTLKKEMYRFALLLQLSEYQ